MSCENAGSASPIERQWHRMRCPECRAARAADRGLVRGIERLQAEVAPAAGLMRTLAAIGVAPATPTRRRNSRRRAAVRRWLLPTGATTAIAAVGIAGWLTYIDIDPNVAVPNPRMPTHNAFDMFRAAHAAMIDEPDISFAITNKPRKVQIKAGQPAANDKGRVGPNYLMKGWTSASKMALLRKNSRALVLLRQGLASSYVSPPIRSVNTMLPYYAEDRQLAGLLELDAQVCEQQGYLYGAVNSRLEAMQLGAEITQGSGIIGKLTGIACETLGRERLWPLVNRLNANQALGAARRLERIIQSRSSFADTLQEEEWTGQASMEEMFRAPHWRGNLNMLLNYTNPRDVDANVYNWPPVNWSAIGTLVLLPYTKSRILDNYSRFLDAQIADARYDYDVHDFQGSMAQEQAMLEQQDPITRVFCPLFNLSRFKDVADGETQDALLLASLALRAYQQEHHAYPRTLTALVPRYLSKAPMDPFGHGKPLQYRYSEQKSLSVDGGQHWYLQLYSVGPDGKDDGGNPIQNALTPGQESYLRGQHNETMRQALYAVKPDSKGDILAGLNTSHAFYPNL